MNYLAILMAMATMYDELAKGGAKVEADKLLANIVPVLGAVSAISTSIQLPAAAVPPNS